MKIKDIPSAILNFDINFSWAGKHARKCKTAIIVLTVGGSVLIGTYYGARYLHYSHNMAYANCKNSVETLKEFQWVKPPSEDECREEADQCIKQTGDQKGLVPNLPYILISSNNCNDREVGKCKDNCSEYKFPTVCGLFGNYECVKKYQDGCKAGCDNWNK